MRSAIAALMTILCVGWLSAQDVQGSADSASPAAPSAHDATADSAPAQPAAQGSGGSPFSFSGGVTLGSDSFPTGSGAANETWTRIGFQPDLGFGKVGVGLNLSVHFMLYRTQDEPVSIYPGDWIPNYDNDGKSLLDLYLPLLMYVRYGQKGTDPFFVKLGSIDDLSLGDGFIMSDYSNMLFMPQTRIFGMDLGLDGAAFGFPYLGFEALTGNLARFDVVGGRLFVRPLAWTQLPILKNLQVGATLVADTDPGLYDATSYSGSVEAYGGDILVPIFGGPFSLSAFTDLAFDPNTSMGWMLGAGGSLFGLVTYVAQLRVLQDGFIPSYFDATYDVFRAQRADLMEASPGSGFVPGWLARLGATFVQDKVVFGATLDGPFQPDGAFIAPAGDPGATPDPGRYLHLRGIFTIQQIPGLPFFVDASYDKYCIGAKNGFFQDLVDPTDAVIGMDINYQTGASVLTLAYNATWDPAVGRFRVTSSLSASVKF